MSDEPQPEFIPCPNCTPLRAAGDWALAIQCRDCAGKGAYKNPATYLCNQCGGPMCPKTTSPNASIPHGLVSARVDGGYDSFHLFDCTTYTFSLCEECLRKMFGTFKIKPAVFNRVGDGEETYEQDEAHYRVRAWRAVNGHIEKLATGLCNATEECLEPATLRHFVSSYMTDEAYCEAHANLHVFANSRYVPENLCKDIPADRDKQTQEHKQRMIEAYMSLTPKDRPTWFQYVSQVVQDITGCEERTGGIWVPTELPMPTWLSEALGQRDVVALVLPSGRLFYGNVDRMHRWVSRNFHTMEKWL